MPGPSATAPDEPASARRRARAAEQAAQPSRTPLELTGAVIRRAQDALRESFTLDDLRLFFTTELSITLDDVVATADRTFQEICQDTVRWALDTDGVGLGGLVAAAAHANAALQPLAAEWAGVEFVLPPCPYPGMVPFSEGQSLTFFGRSAEVESALQALRLHPFLAIIGASGSGKSSLAFAGIVPGMRKATSFGKSKLELITVRPGTAPLERLAAELGVAANGAPPADARPEEVAHYAQTFADAAAERAPAVIVVDQTEEMFGPEARGEAATFARVLLALVGLKRVWLVLTVRADFYSFLIESPLWAEIKEHRLEVGALHGDGLRAAIAEPAHLAGVNVDPALVERLLADAAGEPGALPFIQETMVLLWERAGRLRLTLADYQAIVAGSEGMSGLQVAMARRADQTYNELWDASRPLARRTFVRLIQFGEGRPNTRRQQPVSKLVDPGEDRALFDRTLQRLADSRLLTLSGSDAPAPGGNGSAPDPRVDISHEALLTGWPRLREWIDERRGAEIQRRRFEGKAEEWDNYGRGATGLLDEGEVAEVSAWLESADATEVGASDLLRDLVERSREKIEAAERAEEETRRRELEQQKALAAEQAARIAEQGRANAALRRRALIAAAVGALALAAALVAFLQWGEAGRQRDAAVDAGATAQAERATALNAQATAEIRRLEAISATNLAVQREQEAMTQTQIARQERDRARIAESHRLANLAREQLSVDTVAGIHLALAALPAPRNPRPYVAEAELALQQAVLHSRERAFVPVTLTAPAELESETGVAVGAGRVAVARADRIDLYDADLQPTGSLPLAGAVGLRWGSDGRLLAWTRDEVSIWRGASRVGTLPVDGSASPIYCAEWQPQQEWVAVCTAAELAVVSLGAGTVVTAPLALPPAENPDGTTFAPRVYRAAWSDDGRWLAGSAARLFVWDSATPDEPPRELPRVLSSGPAEPGAYWHFARWSAGGTLATTLAETDLWLWAPDAGDPFTVTLPGLGWPVYDALWPDAEERAVVSSGLGWPAVVDPAARTAVELAGKPGDEDAFTTAFWLLHAPNAPLLVGSERSLYVYDDLDDPEPIVLPFAAPHTAAAGGFGALLALSHAAGLSVVDPFFSQPPVVLAGTEAAARVRQLVWNEDGRLYSLEEHTPGAAEGALRLWDVRDRLALTAFTEEPVTLQPPRAGAPPSCAPLGVARLWGETLGYGTNIGWAGQAAFSAEPLGRLVRWDPASGAQAELAPGQDASYITTAWSADGTRALRLRVGNADAGEEVPVLELFALEGGRWRPLADAPLDATAAEWFEGGILAARADNPVSAEAEGAAWWVDPATGAAQRVLDVAVNGATQLPDGQVALAAADGSVRVLDPAGLSVTESYSLGVAANVLGVAADASGANLLFRVQDRGVELWRRGGSAPAWAYPFTNIFSADSETAVALHPGAGAVAALDGDDLVLLDGASGEVLQRTAMDAENPALAVRWSDDGTRLLTWTQDAVQVWRWDASQLRVDAIQSFPQADAGGLQRNALNAAGDELLALDPSGMALVRWRVWRDYRDLVQEARECFLTHDLTAEQKREFVLD